MSRTIGVVTAARSDFGIYRPILRRIEAHPDLELALLVTGMHLSAEFGSTENEILGEGFEIAERVEMLLSSDSPEAIAHSVGRGVVGFAKLFGRWTPDLLLVLGDRFDMVGAALASLPFGVPIAHIHGGESTEGAIDEALRHSLTKMSHLHFVSHPDYAARVERMGEEPWRVTTCGAPSLDNLRAVEVQSKEALGARVDLDLNEPTLLVTFHPVTLEYADTEAHITALLNALRALSMPTLLTYPNADTHGRIIIRELERFAKERSDARLVTNLGTAGYFGAMTHCTAMVGNSSSGIVESGSFQTPVVDIGSRQRGRLHGSNVLHADPDAASIEAQIRVAISPDFRASLAGTTNVYGDGTASDQIVERLASVKLNARLLQKRFHDGPFDSE